MNEVIENILTRRSIRDFSQKQPTAQEMEVLLNAAIYAPSGANRQTWKFTAILNADIIQELANAIGTIWERENYNFYGAPALIITSNEADSKWGRCDNACAMQNIGLAAHSMGIGTVWINQFFDHSYEPQLRAILTKLGIPQNHVVYGVAAVGYSKSEPKGKVDKVGEYTIVE